MALVGTHPFQGRREVFHGVFQISKVKKKGNYGKVLSLSQSVLHNRQLKVHVQFYTNKKCKLNTHWTNFLTNLTDWNAASLGKIVSNIC